MLDMVFKPMNSIEKKVLECITQGINSAPLVLLHLNKGKKKGRYKKTVIYGAITSLCARKMIRRCGESKHPVLYCPTHIGQTNDMGDDEIPHPPNVSRVHFTGTIVFRVIAAGNLDRIADSTGFTVGGWKPLRPGMKGVEDRWGYVRMDGQDNSIRFRRTIKKGLMSMSVYPKEIWREVPKGTTDDDALEWFKEKAMLIVSILKFNGWQFGEMEIRGEPKPGKGVHYGYPNHPLTELKEKINHMDTERTVDIDSSPGDSAELEGYNAEDGYLLGHLPEEFRRVEGIAAASLEGLETLRRRVEILEGVLDKLVSCEEKVAYIETRRLERETNEIVGKYEPKIFRQEGYN